MIRILMLSALLMCGSRSEAGETFIPLDSEEGCASSSSLGSVNESTVFFGGEGGFCSISNPVPVRGLNSVLYDAVCGDEGDFGEPERLQIVKTLSEIDSRISFITQNGISSFQLCEQTAKSPADSSLTDDYPAFDTFPAGSDITYPQFDGRDSWARFHRTRIREGLKSGPNFAGHFAMIEIGCGTSCRFAYVADALNGQVYKFPFGGEVNYQMQLEYSLSSRLVQMTWLDGDVCVRQSLLFDGRSFETTGEVRNAKIGSFCE